MMKLKNLRKPLILQVFLNVLSWSTALLGNFGFVMAPNGNSLRPDDLQIQKMWIMPEAGSRNLHFLAVGGELDLVLICQFLCTEDVCQFAYPTPDYKLYIFYIFFMTDFKMGGLNFCLLH